MAPPQPDIDPIFDAKRALKEDKYDDCLSCRITGMHAFFFFFLSTPPIPTSFYH